MPDFVSHFTVQLTEQPQQALEEERAEMEAVIREEVSQEMAERLQEMENGIHLHISTDIKNVIIFCMLV